MPTHYIRTILFESRVRLPLTGASKVQSHRNPAKHSQQSLMKVSYLPKLGVPPRAPIKAVRSVI